ncbi:MAG: MBL fold metallo-hydrolase [Treponema sp.]|jgi:glyoxylase-like metal-dependent hydrolase (beta-lactamase superfamily II)|nr:MBL fold metallo-hydrolase [Treponema sp.]
MTSPRSTPRRANASHRANTPYRINARGTNCWIYVPDEEYERAASEEIAASRGAWKPCFLIDPGACPDEIIRKLEGLNLYPTRILLTHGHFDHVGALPDVASYYEAQGDQAAPTIAVHQADALYLGKDSRAAHRLCWSAAGGNTAYIEARWKPMPDPALLLQDGDRAGSLRALHVPGHTPGSVAFFDEEARILFSGDCLFKNAIGRMDLPGGDARLTRDSLNRLFALGDDITVYPGHGGTTIMGAERRFHGEAFSGGL